MNPYAKPLEEILLRLDALSDALDLFDYLVEEAALSGLEADDTLRRDRNLVKGCDSLLWVEASVAADGTLQFRGDSDSMLLRGMLALLEKLYCHKHVPVNAQAGLTLLRHDLLKECFSEKQLQSLRHICQDLENIQERKY